MLWTAGQERLGRESRDRLTELYVTGRDAYIGAQVALGRAKTSGGAFRPGYAGDEAPRATVEAQWATLGRISRMFPGAVRRGDS